MACDVKFYLLSEDLSKSVTVLVLKIENKVEKKLSKLVIGISSRWSRSGKHHEQTANF